MAWDDAARLAHVADVGYHARSAAPQPAEAAALLRGIDVLAATNACVPVLDAALLDAVPRLRAVVLYATGHDHIDADLLASRGVGLSVLPDYATDAVAEHAIAMLLSVATRLHLAHDRSRGLVPATTSLRGIELRGRTMGVVGVGRIGRRVAELGMALGMRVVGCDRDAGAVAAGRGDGVVMTSLDDLLGAADVVMVCASHTFGAPPLLGVEELRRLRPDASVVNVARAALVDTVAAAAAIRGGRLRGYAVDDVVLDPVADGDLLAEGRVLQTGHSAWWRDEVLERGRRMWARHLLAAIDDAPLGAVTWPGQVAPRVAVLPVAPAAVAASGSPPDVAVSS